MIDSQPRWDVIELLRPTTASPVPANMSQGAQSLLMRYRDTVKEA